MRGQAVMSEAEGAEVGSRKSAVETFSHYGGVNNPKALSHQLQDAPARRQ